MDVKYLKMEEQRGPGGRGELKAMSNYKSSGEGRYG